MTLKETEQAHIFNAADASVVHHSAPIDMGAANYLSIEMWWTGLTTGTSINANFIVETSNSGIKWSPKTGAALNVASTDGNDLISLNMVVSERFARVSWDAVGVTGGTIDGFICAKG